MPERRIAPQGQVSLRKAEARDVEAICAIGADVFASSFGHSMPPDDLAAYLHSTYDRLAMASELARPDVDTIVAAGTRDHVLGFCQLRRGSAEPCLAGVEQTVELQRLYVSRDVHGAGVGSQLAARIEEMARAQGFSTIWLGVWEENFGAQRFYERFGYRRVGEHDFVMGTCVQTDWILSKEL